MPEDLKIIWILAIGLGFACTAAYFAQRLKLSPLLGYLFAGYLIGPNSPGFIADQYISDQLASIGVTLLMFTVGLNFNWKDIYSVKNIVVAGAGILSFLSICAGIFLSVHLGESVISGFVIGVAICVSSTVVVVRVLTDNNLLNTKAGHIVMGWTIVEDLISVFGLILLPTLVYSSLSDLNPALAISYAIFIVFLKILALGLIVYFIGNKVIEKILKIIARTRSHELFTLAILSSVFILAVGSSYFFGISIALGAFIAGTVVGKTNLSHQAAANALPMRDTFAVVFFLSVGMLFNPAAVLNNLPLFLGILVILLVIRPLLAFLIIKIAKYPTYVCFTVAFATCQIGEYSFILAEEGSRLNVLPDNAYDILVACAFITIALNPLLFQWFKPLTQKKTRRPLVSNPSGKAFYEPKVLSEESLLPKAIVIGYGPVGRAVANELKNKYQVVIIDQNIDIVSTVKNKNMEMFYGDATQVLLLEQAKLENAQIIVITTPDVQVTASIIASIQQINPWADIIARIHYKSDYHKIHLKNISIICDEEATCEKIVAQAKLH